MRKIKKLILLLAVCAAAVMAAHGGIKRLTDRFFPLEYTGYIERYSAEYGLDKYLVMAVIDAESGFDATAHSGKARGLMQLTPETAEWIAGKLGVEYYEDIEENPELNIKMGCWYLSYLTGRYENTETALAAYNAGMGNVSGWLESEQYSPDGESLAEIPYGETRRYVSRVALLEKIYRNLY